MREAARPARAPPPPLASLEGVHEITGVVRSDPRLSGTIARLDLRVESIDGAAAEGGLRLTLPAPRQPLRAGDRIAATLEVERPGAFDEFDYAAFLRGRGIHAVAAYPQRWTLLERDAEHAIVDALRGVRRWALGNIERALPEPEASLAAGMLLGRQRTMPAALEEDLRRTGTTHLLVVSGQNIALLLGTAVGLLGAVVARRQAALIALALLPGYVVLTGAEPPVVRAAIMAVGIAIAAISGRRTPAWIYLAYAVALMLALRPLLIGDVAFQLSATATAGVLLIAPPLRDRALARLGAAPGSLAAGFTEAAAVAVGASLAVLPVQAAAFGTLPLLQAPANVVVAPLYEATVLIAVLAALLGWIEPVARLVEVAGVFAPAAFVAAVEAMAALPLAIVELRPSPLAAAVWFALLGGLVWLLNRRATLTPLPGQRARLAAPVALAAAAAGLWLAVLTPSDGLASVTVLDVGQGQAILVRDGGAAVLVDAGPADGAVLTALPRVLDGLSLDAVLLTHGDSDHAGGLAELRRRLRIGVLLGSAETLAAVSSRGRLGRHAGARHRRSHPAQRADLDRGALATSRHGRPRAPRRQQPLARAAGDDRRAADPAARGHRGPRRAVARRERARSAGGRARAAAPRLAHVLERAVRGGGAAERRDRLGRGAQPARPPAPGGGRALCRDRALPHRRARRRDAALRRRAAVAAELALIAC